MIDASPLRRTLTEKDLSIQTLSQLTGIEERYFYSMMEGRGIDSDRINKICSVLNCQPSDVIEFRNTETKGHWVYVEEK